MEIYIMNKMFSFLAGALCGALVGSVTALLLTPASGPQLKAEAKARLDAAMKDAREEMEATRQELSAQFERMKMG
jgi:gas vesicle protein